MYTYHAVSTDSYPARMGLPVYLERGTKRVFAGALAWPGWSRSGRSDDEALETLLSYAERYARAIGVTATTLRAPRTVAGLDVVETLTGDATTDFGAPGVPPAADDEPVTASQLRSLVEILEASWRAFDAAAKAAGRKTLKTGPRGGGRDVAKMRAHVLEADGAYLAALGVPGREVPGTPAGMRAAFVDALGRRAHGELPNVGPRGGRRWSARYAIRRSAWHALDHAWEIEDRLP